MAEVVVMGAGLSGTLMAYELVERLTQVAGEEPFTAEEMVVGLQKLGPQGEEQGNARQWPARYHEAQEHPPARSGRSARSRR